MTRLLRWLFRRRHATLVGYVNPDGSAKGNWAARE
jgi:hypothetical protein